MPKKPHWKIPKNMQTYLEENDGIWEDDRWSPILLTAMSGTELDGQEIQVAWQIEFDPSENDCAAANETLKELGFDTDGYGWGDFVLMQIKQMDSELACRLHMGDCETDTCVIWVESEQDCQMLLEVVSKAIHAN